MSRLHSTLVALVLGAAACAGFFAAVHTVRLGQKASVAKPVPVAARELAARRAKLTRWSHSLEQARTKRPPALPKLPEFAPVQTSQAATPASGAAPAPTAPPPVEYVQPQQVIKYRRASAPAAATTSGTTESWSDDSGGSDDGGAGDGSGAGGD